MGGGLVAYLLGAIDSFARHAKGSRQQVPSRLGGHGVRFPGEQGLVDLQVAGGQDDPVGMDRLSRGE